MRDETSGTTLPVIESMARREAAALLQHPRLETWVTHPAVAVSLRIVPCPWPGCRAPGTQAGLLPLASAEPLSHGERPRAGSVTLTALSCEWLSPRSLLPLAQAGAGGRVPSVVMTRAAALVRLLARGTLDGWVSALPALDARERWFDDLVGRGAAASAAGPREPVLPASSRSAWLAAGRARRSAYASHLVSPHLAGERTRSLNDAYLRCRLAAVAGAFETAAFEGAGGGRTGE